MLSEAKHLSVHRDSHVMLSEAKHLSVHRKTRLIGQMLRFTQHDMRIVLWRVILSAAKDL